MPGPLNTLLPMSSCSPFSTQEPEWTLQNTRQPMSLLYPNAPTALVSLRGRVRTVHALQGLRSSDCTLRSSRSRDTLTCSPCSSHSGLSIFYPSPPGDLPWPRAKSCNHSPPKLLPHSPDLTPTPVHGPPSPPPREHICFVYCLSPPMRMSARKGRGSVPCSISDTYNSAQRTVRLQ